MSFNSIEFGLFLPIVFTIYWLIGAKRIKAQNYFLLLASYFFYACWDWRFLSLIMISTLVDYSVAHKIARASALSSRKAWLAVSLVANLGLLATFKYFNFFADSFSALFTFLGCQFDPVSLSIILPVGISFYTFQTLSYTIDVYRGKTEAVDDFPAFAGFVSFFPQLVAGPIERASRFLPQFLKRRFITYPLAVLGLRQILWGLFKKVVIADNCATIANVAFDGYENASGGVLLVGAVCFAFQIYGDFSGYSDIAIGAARLLGFDLQKNFAFPYFSRDIGEFWRRWHISLTTWFRDYVYIPLGGSRGPKIVQVRNVLIVFIVSGLWHGANWTFVFWGLINALFFLPLLLSSRNRANLDVVAKDRMLPTPVELMQILSSFSIVVLGWIFFRSATLGQAFSMIDTIFSASLFEWSPSLSIPSSFLPITAFFIATEWAGRADQFAIEKSLRKAPRCLRWAFYYLIMLLLLFYGGEQQEFIYFQF